MTTQELWIFFTFTERDLLEGLKGLAQRMIDFIFEICFVLLIDMLHYFLLYSKMIPLNTRIYILFHDGLS